MIETFRILAEQICEAGRRLYLHNLVAGSDGNISARLPDGMLLITPTGVSKGYMDPDQLTILDENGKWLAGAPASSELKMHRAIYAARPDISAIIHAHPPTAIAWSLRFPTFEKTLSLLPEAEYALQNLSLAPFAPLGSETLARGAATAAQNTNTILLERHGAVTLGKDIFGALFRMESLEHCASIALANHRIAL